MPTVLTVAALKELESLLALSRRDLSSIYREWKTGMTIQEMAESRNHTDLKIVKESVAALRVLFGREQLPKRGSGRQKIIYEAQYWLNSDVYISPELTDHFEKILLKAEKTNTRRLDYEPPLPPKNVYKQARENIANTGDFPGVYVISKKSFIELHTELNKPLIVKIGWSTNVWDRIAGAQTWDPDPLVVLRVFPCRAPNVIEAKMHIVLDTLGLTYGSDGGKEWFTADLSLIDAIAASLHLENAADD